MKKATYKIESDSFDAQLVVHNPGYTPSKTSVAFSISWMKPGSEEILGSTTGWRVYKGSLTPPSTKDRKGIYHPTAYLSPRLVEMVKEMVLQWEGEFPMVEFPKRVEIVDKSATNEGS